MDYSFELVRRTTPINIKEICKKFEDVNCTAKKPEQGKLMSEGPVSSSSIKVASRPMPLGPKPIFVQNPAFKNVQPPINRQQFSTNLSQIPVRPSRTRKYSAKKKLPDETTKTVCGLADHQGSNTLHKNNESGIYRTRTSSLSVADRKKLYEELDNTAKTNGQSSPRTVQNISQVNGHVANGCQVTYAVPIKFSELSGRYRRTSLKRSEQQNDTSKNICFSTEQNTSSPTENVIRAPLKPPRTFAHDKYLADQNPTELKFVSNSKNTGFHKVKKIFHVDGKPTGKFVPHLPPKPIFVQQCAKTNLPTNKVPYEYATPMKLGKPPKPNVFFDYSELGSNHRHYGTLRKSFSEEHVYEEPSDSIPTRSKCFSRIDANSMQTSVCEPTSPQLHYLCVPLLDLPSDSIGSSKTLGRPQKLSPLQRFNSPKSGKSSLNNIRDVVNQSFVQLWRRLYPQAGNGDTGEHDGTEDVGADSGSEVSMKDVQERIIYVRSLRKQIVGTPSRKESSSECNRLFNNIYVSCLTDYKGGQRKPRLMFKFPQEQKETVYDHSIIPQLSFPDYSTLKQSTAYKSETFISILVDEKGEKTYCYCLRLIGSPSFPTSTYISLPVAVCLLTSHNSSSFYMKVLLEIEKHLILPEEAIREYISSLYNAHIPTPGSASLFPDKIEGGDSSVSILRPLDNRIVDAKLTSLLQHLEIDLLLKIIGSLILERRVLLVADSCSTLFESTNAVLAVLYPLSWQHSVLAVLPDCLLAQACTASPFLFGVLSQSYHKVVDMQKDKILIVDVDQGMLMKEVGDEDTILPSRVQKALKIALNLAKNMTDPTEMLRDVMISEAFLRMFVETLGNVDNFITTQNIFQREAFCKSHSSRGIQMFLQWFTETQMFDVFIRKRLVSAKLQQFWDVQPGHTVKQSLFDRRIQEYWCSHMPSGLRGNVRELGKKVKTFGEKLKHLKAF